MKGIADDCGRHAGQMSCPSIQQGEMQVYTASLEAACDCQWNIPGAAGDVQQLEPPQCGLVHHTLHQAFAGAHPSKPAVYAAKISQRGSNFRRCPAIAVQQFAIDLAPHVRVVVSLLMN